MDLEDANGTRLIGEYILGPRIGAGSFSVVWRATHCQSGIQVAVKEIDKKQLHPVVNEDLMREIEILRNINHPNIIRLIDVIQIANRIYLVLEYCDGGDLASYIHRGGKVSEAVARHFMRQLAAGLQILNEKNLFHPDLKPQNLLLSTNEMTPLLKMGNFGFARHLKPLGLADTLCGSPLYMAPEIIQNQKYDAKADLWSVGVILFQLVTGKPLFDGNSQLQLFQNILTSCELRFPQSALEELHPDCVDLCRSLLRQNPDERLSFVEFFNHKFLVVPKLTVDVEHSSLLPQVKYLAEQFECLTDENLPSVFIKRPQLQSGLLLNPSDGNPSLTCLPLHDRNINILSRKDHDSTSIKVSDFMPNTACDKLGKSVDGDFNTSDRSKGQFLCLASSHLSLCFLWSVLMEDGELDSDSSSYRVLSSKTLADIVEALIGVYYVEGGKNAASHLMKGIGIQVEFDSEEIESTTRSCNVPENILRSVDFDALEDALNIKFKDRGLLIDAITHASRLSSGVSCYQRLEFIGDGVLNHLITKHLFFTYNDLAPGRLTDLRAAAVSNENFACVAVKHNLHAHLRFESSALEKQIRDFVKEVQEGQSKPEFNSFGLGNCKAPKVLGDIVESIAGALYLDCGRDTVAVWKVFQPLLHPLVTPETLTMEPVRELQERCARQAKGLEYKTTRSGNITSVEVFIDGVWVGDAQNPQTKMARKLAARNALVVLKEKETAQAKEENDGNGKKNDENGKKKKNGIQTSTRQTLNDICLRRDWPLPIYQCVNEDGPAHAKRFTFSISVNGWMDGCVGEPMPSFKKAKDSAAVLLLELLSRCYP